MQGAFGAVTCEHAFANYVTAVGAATGADSPDSRGGSRAPLGQVARGRDTPGAPVARRSTSMPV